MLFAKIVETSQRVTATPKRLEKIEMLAALLTQLDPQEVEAVVSFLSGSTRQGRIGIGYATLRDAAAPEAESPSLEILEVDRLLGSLTAVQGRGSEREKVQILHSLLDKATSPEQRFLTGLLLGELRQGALEGVMLEAVAKAARVDLDRVRRAVMMAGNLARVARSALESGAAGLDQYGLELFRPVHPMLAQTSEDVGAAVGEFGESALEYKLDGARVQVHRSRDEVHVFSRSLNELTLSGARNRGGGAGASRRAGHPGWRNHQPHTGGPPPTFPGDGAAIWAKTRSGSDACGVAPDSSLV